jgi:hypothetical protein
MGRYPSKFKDIDKDGGRFIQLPVAVLECKNYKLLSHPAKALLIELARQYRGGNNGSLLLSMAYLKPRGWSSSDVVQRAKNQLLDLGFIFETVKGHRPNKASWYALTWRGLDQINGYDPHAKGAFVRSAYSKSPEINNSLIPSNKIEPMLIAPSERLDNSLPTPSQGAMRGTFN